MKEIFCCHQCFPCTEDSTIFICQSCEKSFVEGKTPDDCSVNNAIGREHRYPPKLDKLVISNRRKVAYGYVAGFAVDKKACRGVEYRKQKAK
jgi:hypothetical protein